MTVRTVTVRLRADISAYTRAMGGASASTSQLAGAGMAASAVLVAGFAAAVSASAKFDKSLSNVRAVSGASAKEMAGLRAAALEAGKATSFTASQAADAEAELARAGVSVANITGGALKGSLALAAAGQLDLSESATIAAQAMNTFGLQGKDVSHIADVLAAGANKSASDVHGLGESLRMGGLLAKQTGLSLEDTVGTLSAFADHALIGSDAGTSLKTMLMRLTPQSVEAQDAMNKLGFSAYDSTGKFVGLSELAARMQGSFSKLTPEARNAAMGVIFGSDAVRSATIMYELGSAGIDKYVAAVDDQGAASRMAGIQMDNLSGDMESLRGSIEVALIEGGSAANGVLRDMVQWVTKLVNAYSSLPPGLQHAVTMFSGVAGAAGLAATGMLLLLPRIAATRTALTGMGVTAARTRTAMVGLGKVGGILVALEAVSFASKKLQDVFADAPPSVSKMGNSLVDLAQKGKTAGELSKTFGENLDGFSQAVKRIAHPSGTDRTTDIVNSMTLDLTKGIAETNISLDAAHDKITSFDQAMAGLVQSGNAEVAGKAFAVFAKKAEESGTSTEKLKSLLPEYTDALASTEVQSKLTAEGQTKLGESAEMTKGQFDDTSTAVEKLTAALKSLNGVNIDAAESQIGFRKSLADLTDTVKDNGHSLDVTTEKGREVKGAFLDAAKAAMAHAEAVAEQKNSVEAGNAVLAQDVEALKATMRAAHFSEDAIQQLTAAYAQLPPTATTKVTAQTGAAAAALTDVRTKLAAIPPGKSLTIRAPSADAIKALQQVGYKVQTLPDGLVRISVPTSGQKQALADLQRRIDSLHGTTVENRIVTTHIAGGGAVSHEGGNYNANGSILDFYADGGLREQHVAQIAPAGSWRVWGEPETGGESYIPLAPSKRGRSRMIAEETVKRLGGRSIQWFAGGGITYTPSSAPQLHQVADSTTRYNDLVKGLQGAWAKVGATAANQRKQAQALAVADAKASQVRRNGARLVQQAEANLQRVRSHRHSASQLAAAEDRLSNARASSTKATTAATAAANKQRVTRNNANAALKSAQGEVYAANASLGLPRDSKVGAFSLTGYAKVLADSLVTTNRWRASLDKIATRGGAEVRDILQGMGEDGYDLVTTLANASDSQFRDIVSKLKATAGTASATLADLRKQLDASTASSAAFAKDLQTLASRGFGDLAQALAGMGGADAAALAHQAATGSDADAAAANASVVNSSQALTGDDLTNALVLLSTLRGGIGRGYADLIAAGLDTGAIRALVPKMLGQITALPDAYKAKFLAQWAGQGGTTAMARGGITDGRNPVVIAGENREREAYIPLNGSVRSRALLGRTAAAMGYQLVPAGRFASPAASTSAPAQEVSKQPPTINLYGAKQSSAEQAADIARHMTFVG